MGGTITPFPGATASHQPCSPAKTPCEHRRVTADGRVVCRKVARGDAEVSPALCASCPAALVGCAHLRFTLHKYAPVPIVVRYAGGRTEVWDDVQRPCTHSRSLDDVPPAMRFARAACVLRCEAIDPADCAGCALRAAILAAMAMEEQRRVAAARSA